MAHSGIFATAAECIAKTGYGASATYQTEAYINQFCTEAESFINVLCRTNYSDTYTTLNVDKKGILKEACTNLVAIYIINNDPRGFNNLRTAENIINTNWARFIHCIGLLKDQNSVTFLNAT